jgi:F-type H+-transporting ATPase subunit b
MRHAGVFAAESGHEGGSILLPAIPDLVWGSIAFIIVVIVIAWKVIPNVNKALDARKDAIEGGIERAEKAQAEANEARDQYRAQLADARSEAAAIREAARGDGDKIIAEKKEQAQAEAARIIAAAQAQIEAERQSALHSLRTDVGSLALDLASNVVGETLNDDKKATALVDRFLADLEASESASKATK